MSAFVRLQKILPQHLISRAVGGLAASESWVRGPLIRTFARVYGIDMSDAERSDLESYRSFNDFFTRSLTPDARPIDPTPGAIVSPADGVVSQTGIIEDGQLLQAKSKDCSKKLIVCCVGSIRQSEIFPMSAPKE